MNNIIELKQVVKLYERGSEKIHAVDRVNLSIEQGEFVAIVGPSGSGKSTLLNLIGCVDIPTSGTVKVDGLATQALKEKELAKIRNTKIGFVFQQFFLLPTLTALENVTLPAVFSRNGHRTKKTNRAKELLDLVGLTDRANHLPSELSGGEMQRIAIARALINSPKILLADEPTGNLDSANAEIVYNILDKLHKDGLTVIAVTHNLELANKTQKIFKLKDGKMMDE
ncbi:ABC transporter ATP-binding protein [Stygiobacter electus]|uniref:ABC transporter ATP-binding protein n=1 Tax=Stygiobacter electus TaxID=3032292 RepID=A0AAE3NZJ1_9BACT|nr:ABC transporter ATP-binding protein [Stygiobacter electus]MDF1611364.1 ABC transporter ATP-binding protein [Stygiobacter electus]